MICGCIFKKYHTHLFFFSIKSSTLRYILLSLLSKEIVYHSVLIPIVLLNSCQNFHSSLVMGILYSQFPQVDVWVISTFVS